MKKRVMIVDDHAVLRHMMMRVLTTEGVYEIVGEAGNGFEALDCCKRCRPEVMIMDLQLRELCGTEVLRRVRAESTNVRVLIFSGTRDQALIVEALKARPHGFVEKRDSLDTFLNALGVIASGKSYFSALASALWADSVAEDFGELTRREVEVLQLVAESRSSKEIATRLGLAQKTVDNHRANLMDKLHRHDIAALTRYAVRRGMVSSD